MYVWRDRTPLRESTDRESTDRESTAGDVPDDLEYRLILPMLNEAVAVLRELVVKDADLLDAGAIFATGFAPCRGGPVHYARTRGIDAMMTRLRELESRYGARFTPDAGWDRLASVARRLPHAPVTH